MYILNVCWVSHSIYWHKWSFYVLSFCLSFCKLVYGNLTMKNKVHFFSCCYTYVSQDKAFTFYGQITSLIFYFFILMLKINFIKKKWLNTYQTGQLGITGGWIGAGGCPVCHSWWERSCWWGGSFLNGILLLHLLYIRATLKFHVCLQWKTDVMTYWKLRDSARLKLVINIIQCIPPLPRLSWRAQWASQIWLPLFFLVE